MKTKEFWIEEGKEDGKVVDRQYGCLVGGGVILHDIVVVIAVVFHDDDAHSSDGNSVFFVDCREFDFMSLNVQTLLARPATKVRARNQESQDFKILLLSFAVPRA
jgi:hypothetical protein